jgi:RNA polymerase sigma factor (sigma-70 family)
MLGSRDRLLRSGANRLDSSGEEVMMEPSDAEVIAASIGDPPAFGALFDRHAAVLFRFLVRRVGPDVADTLLGEAFRIAFERRATFDVSRTTARPWLYGIATNVLAKHRRTEARRLRATAHLAAGQVLQDDPAEQVAAAVDADELWPRVANAIAELPDPERNVLLLFAWEELSYDEIATALSVPVGTVRSRLNRGRRRLRELAAPSGEEQSAKASSARRRIAP